MSADNEIYTQLDRITDHLATMTKQIDGTVYAVRAFFKEDARENITDKVQRIILKSDDNSKEI